MAIIKHPTDLDSPINYIATLAFFCCVSCTVLMLRFGGFKASLNLTSWRRRDDEISPTLSISGAYRVNRDEFYGNGNSYDPPKKLTPSMVKLPPSFDPEPKLRPTKSTNDLVRQTVPPQLQLHKSTHNISQDPGGEPSNNYRKTAPPVPPERKRRDAKNEEKERKKLEKQRLAEQKAREKAAAQEQARQEKLNRERERKAAQEQAKIAKRNKKSRAAPQPPQPQAANPLARAPAPPPPPPQDSSYSTNTLESSISKSSGPPPYSESANREEVSVEIGNSNPSNVSFSKPIDKQSDSWDLISQHRQQMSRPVSSGPPKGRQKNMVMDLQYKLGPSNDKDNSEA